MPPNSNSSTEVHQCVFSARIIEAHMIIKFPCKLFIALKNTSDQEITRTQKDNVTLQNNIAQFNQNLCFKTFMLFQKSTQRYLQKETKFSVFLTPARKPKEENFVGWLSLDLSDVIENNFKDEKKHQLQFGTIKNRFLVFSSSLVSKKVINKKPKEIDLSSFSMVEIQQMQQDLKSNSVRIPQPIAEQEEPYELKTSKQNVQVMNLSKPPPIKKSKLASDDGSNSGINEESELIKKLEEENRKMFEMISMSNERLQKQKGEKENLEELLKVMEKKIGDIETERDNIVQQMVNQVQEETKKLRVVEKQLKENEEVRMEYETQNLQLRYELASARQEIQSRNEENNKFNQHQFLTSYNILKQEKQKLQQHLMAMQRDMDKIQEQKKDLQSKLLRPGQSGMSNNVEEFEQKLYLVQKQIQKLTSQIRLYEVEKLSLKQKIHILEEQNAKLSKTLKDNSNIHSQKQLQLKTTKKYLQNKDNQISELTHKMQAFMKSYKEGQNDSKKQQLEIKRLQNIIKSINREKEDQHNKKQNLNSQFTQMNKIRTELTNKNLMLSNEIQTLTLKYQKSQKELKSKQEMLKERKVYSEVLSKQIEQEIKNAQQQEQKITKFAEKQMKMRENILVLEEESRKIYEIVLEKEENEQVQNQIISEKQQELQYLKIQLHQTKLKLQEILKESSEYKKELYSAKKQTITKRSNELFENQNKMAQLSILNNERIQELQMELQKVEQIYRSRERQQKSKYERLEKEKNKIEKEKVGSLEREKVELKSEKNDLIQRNKWLQHNIRELQNKISDLEMQIDKTINTNKHKLNFQKEEESLVKKQNTTLQKEVEELQLKLNEQKYLSNKYIQQIHHLEMGKYEGSQQQQASHNSQLSHASQDLKKLLQSRSEKQQYQNTIELLIGKISVMEHHLLYATKERGVIQQTARKLSMQIQQIKSNFLKGKVNLSDKKEVFQILKPCEEVVKEIINLAENLSQINVQMEDD